MKKIYTLIWLMMVMGLVFGQTYHIGDLYTAPDGSQGVVFYENPDGSGGLVVALNNASNGCIWGASSDVISLDNLYPTYFQQLLDDTAGYSNTQKIRAANAGTSLYAAGVVDFDNGWFLPSPAQLTLLYAMRPFISDALLAAGGTLMSDAYYWSSAEYSSANAWVVDFGDYAISYSGAFYNRAKSSSYPVRAIRSFINTTLVTDTTLTYSWSTGESVFDIMVLPSQTTTYTVTVSTSGGCSDTAQHTIVVNTPVTAEITQSACDSYEWNGQTYTESGEYTQSFVAANGCDSVVTLYLTINNPQHQSTMVTAYESYTWHGETYTQSGVHLYAHQDLNGCEQVDTLHLTIISSDYLPDNIDSASCTYFPQGNEWGIRVGWSSEYTVSNLITPMVGDLDDDGNPEVVCFSSAGDVNDDPRKNNILLVYDGVTCQLKRTINLSEYVTAFDAAPYGLVKLPNRTGLIVVACYDYKLRAYDITSASPNTPYWVSDVDYGEDYGDWAVNLGFADFNHDGHPEVYVRDKIYNAETGVLLASANSQNQGMSYAHWTHGGHQHYKLSSPCVADVCGDNNLELILGNEAYAVNIANTSGMAGNSISLTKQITPPGGATRDGHAQVADFNSDGHLDVFVSVRDTDITNGTVYAYVWDVNNDTVSNPLVIPTDMSGKSFATIADIDNDGQLEVLLQCGIRQTWEKFRAYKYDVADMSFALMWGFSPDEDSYSNAITAFDFNQDGILELLICDQSNVRIVNGSGISHITHNDTVPMYVMNTFWFSEVTIMQYPVIADVDGDGSAEIVSVGSNRLNFFKSTGTSWAPARKVWNQYMYNVTHVNEDLTIPRYQFNNATLFTDPEGVMRWPFNNFLQQATSIDQYGRPYYGAADATVVSLDVRSDRDSVYYTFTFCNQGDFELRAPYHYILYAGSYGGDTILCGQVSEPLFEDSCQKITVGIHIGEACGFATFDSLIAVVNCRGNGIAQNGGLQLECDTSNNMLSVPMTDIVDTVEFSVMTYEPFAWYENVYSESGVHDRYIHHEHACDSLLILYLTVLDDTISLPDNVDSADCVFFPEGTEWGIQTAWQSENIVSVLNTPMVGDLDGDGIPEIVCFAREGDNSTGDPRCNNHLLVFDGRSKAIKASFVLPSYVSGFDASAYGLVRLPNGPGLIVVACFDYKLRAYDITAADPSIPYWVSDTDFGESGHDWAVNVSFADFNHDGHPEVFVRNKVYNAETGVLLAAASTNTHYGASYAHWTNTGAHPYKLSSPIAADVCGDVKLDLILGNEVYDVNINNIAGTLGNSITLAQRVTPPGNAPEDGHPQVADFNNDGYLDIFISVRNTHESSGHVYGYVWDLHNQTVSTPFDILTGWSGKSIPLIADIDNDNLLEVLIQSEVSWDPNKFQTYKYHPDTMVFTLEWGFPTDENSYSNSITAFDFNQDGLLELMISDQNTMRIVNGSGISHITHADTISMYVLNSFSFAQNTIMQYPVIADVDADGSAEIVSVGSDRLNILKSSTSVPWAPARKVWNQYMYNVTNVNEDLTIPRYLFNNATVLTDPEAGARRPYNNFLQQSTTIDQYGRPFYAVPDVAMEAFALSQTIGDTLVLTYSYCNYGDNTLNAPYSVMVFANRYGGEVLATLTVNENLPVDSCSQGKVYLPSAGLCALQSLDSMVIVVNCEGTGIAQNGGLQPECDTTNNMVTIAFSLHGDTTHVTETACDTFDWYEHVGITQSGDYTHVFTNAIGCDSIVIMHLMVLQSTHNVFDTTVCDQYTWTMGTGETYTISDSYTFAYTNADGCASVDTLHLTIIPIPVLSHTPDTVIIEGSSVTLWASGADILYWMDGNDSIIASGNALMVTPESSTVYYLNGQNYSAALDENVVSNGDFELGNAGFSSAYNYSTNLWPAGNYYIGPNARNYHTGFYNWPDHTTGMGNYMIINGAESPNTNVWTQTVSVSPNTNYAFSVWVCSVGGNPQIPTEVARLQFSVNGVQVGDVFTAPDSYGQWGHYYEVWNSGEQTSAIITILNQNTAGGGNDFGIDDISFTPLTECSVTDTIHVFVTGYPDNVDSADCVFFPDGTEWGIEVGWSSDNIVSNLNIPLVGDLDNDGHPEIICFSSNGQSPNAPNTNSQILVFDGVTKQLKTTITMPSPVTAYDAAAYGMVKLPSGKGLIVTACYDFKLRAYDITASNPDTPFWISDVNYGSNHGDWGVNVSFADFNHDGHPEVYVRNKIYSAETGALLVSIQGSENSGSSYCHYSHYTNWKLSSPMAADVCDDSNLELILGNEIYGVNIVNPYGTSGNTINLVRQVTPPNGVPVDGNVQVADFNSDGFLDVFISIRNTAYYNGYVYCYVWDVHQNTVSTPLTINTWFSGKSIPMLADIDNDGLIELLIQCDASNSMEKFRAYKYLANTQSFNYLWGLGTDEDSYSNGITSFDFNQDGLLELMICDQSTVRIVNGSGRSHVTQNDTIPVYVMGSFPFSETTIMQYPIIVDVDADGNAEIVSVGSDKLNILESSGPSWAPARKVWNQYMYNVTNVNEDLTIPQFLFNNAMTFIDPEGVVRRPYNNFLQQATTIDQYGRPFYAVPDVAMDASVSSQMQGNDTLALTFSYCNQGDNTLNAPYSVTIFADTFGGDTVCTFMVNESLPVDSCAQGYLRVPFRALCGFQSLDSLVIAVNCAGAGIAQNGGLQPECDTTNNLVTIAFSLHTDTTHVTETTCDTFDWHEHVGITQSGDYTHVFTNESGCDSMVVMHLTVFHSTHNVLDTTACESYTWTEGDGETYTTSGLYTYNYTNAEGCSSADTLHLTVLYGTHNVYDTTVCESYTWTEGDGETYTTSGLYTYNYINADGCSSVDTLHLTVLYGTHNVYDTTVCESYTWTEGDGETYTSSGVYTYSYTNATGCASADT
ncbi:MAG: VCBS repeat-containing protein, partial [Bacteroidales bacterium]|nr:VCBS repeat-containing protein [Bacteroidales bacterium]